MPPASLHNCNRPILLRPPQHEVQASADGVRSVIFDTHGLQIREAAVDGSPTTYELADPHKAGRSAAHSC